MEYYSLFQTGDPVNFQNSNQTGAETGYYETSAEPDNLAAIIKNNQIIIEDSGS